MIDTGTWLPSGALAHLDDGYREEFRAFESMSYQYNEFGVFTGSDGRVFVAVTSGCSCSSPWDDTSRADLEPVSDISVLRRKLNDWNGNPGTGCSPLNAQQLTEAHGRLADLRLF